MSQDVNDMRLDAETIADAAKNSAPIGVHDDAARARLADAGRVALTECIDTMEIAQDKAARIDLFRGLFNGGTIAMLRAFMWADKIGFRSQMMRLKPLNMVTDGKDLEKLIRESSPKDAEPKDLRRLTGEPKVPLQAPPNYVVDERGVFERHEDHMTLIAAAPVIIRAIAHEPDSPVVRLQLAWKVAGKWTRKSVDRYHAMDARSLTRLASAGCPVHSGNATDLVKYLAAFEAHNIGKLPTIQVSTHMGWTGDDFMWGSTCLTGDMRLTAEDGLLQRAKGYRSGGTWEEWCKAVEALVCPSPLAMLGIYASACAPLLSIIGAPGFCLDQSGETSHGKSTVMRVAASVWGEPDSVTGSWASSSTVGPTITAWFLQSMPVLLDDTKRGKPEVIGSLMYDIPAGQERIKGSADGGLRELKRWHTVLISNGEAPITSFTNDAGAHARCLCIQGAPIQSGEQAKGIDRAFRDHYGHLGPKVVRYASENRERLTERYRGYRDHYDESATSNVEGRMSAYLAALRIAADVCTIVGVPHPVKDPIEEARKAMLDGAKSADKPHDAMQAALTWAVANRKRFYGRTCMVEPVMGWCGVWTDSVGFTEQALRRIMDDCGYRLDDVLKGWQSRGWLDTPNDRMRKRVTMGDNRVRVFMVSLSCFESFVK